MSLVTHSEPGLPMPKRDLGGIKYWRFARNTLRKTKIQNLHPKRDDEHPRLFHMGVPPRGVQTNFKLP